MANKMSEYGAALQSYNQELVKCLEDIKLKRSEVLFKINEEESQKETLEKNMRILQEQLNCVKNSLQKHRELYNGYEKTIKETENGFKKILESSQMLLHVAQQEADLLQNSHKSNK